MVSIPPHVKQKFELNRDVNCLYVADPPPPCQKFYVDFLILGFIADLNMEIMKYTIKLLPLVVFMEFDV